MLARFLRRPSGPLSIGKLLFHTGGEGGERLCTDTALLVAALPREGADLVVEHKAPLLVP